MNDNIIMFPGRKTIPSVEGGGIPSEDFGCMKAYTVREFIRDVCSGWGNQGGYTGMLASMLVSSVFCMLVVLVIFLAEDFGFINEMTSSWLTSVDMLVAFILTMVPMARMMKNR